MPLQCNIDAKGKAVRMAGGVVFVLVGIAMMIVLWASSIVGWGPWAVAVLIILGGGFAIFESRAGWCVLRAMGVNTRI